MKHTLSVILVLILALALIPTAFAEDEFKIGETWTVDDLLSLTILAVTETDSRNEYSDKNPAAVYIVDYAYTNLGYEDNSSDGLFISLDDKIVDAAGMMGYSYPGDYTYYAHETPIGATCYAQACIGVDNPGNFKLYVTKYDNDSNQHKAIFNVELSAVPASLGEPSPIEPFDGALRQGETWTVDGQWSLTINSIIETNERNSYSDYAPGAVYIVDYTYTNLGYEDEYNDGLFFSLDDCIVDHYGYMGYSYPGDITYYPQETPVGATCNAQACFGVWHSGDVQFVVSKYDSNDVRQSAKFYMEAADHSLEQAA